MRSIVLALALLAVGCRREAPPVAPEAPPGALSVLFLALPRGEAALVQTPDGEALLVDGGGAGDGEAVRAVLRDRGVARLTGAVATHPAPAHVEGLIEILRDVPVGWLMDSGFPDLAAPGVSREMARSVEGRLTRRIMEVASSRGVEYRLGRAGQEIPLGEHVTIEVLAPSEPFITGTPADADNASIVFRLVHGEVRFLFTGGVGLAAQERVLVSPEARLLPADVLRAPGGGRPLDLRVLDRVGPRLVLWQGGGPARPGIRRDGAAGDWPDPETRALLEQRGAEVRRLSRTLLVSSDGREFRVHPPGERSDDNTQR